VDTPLCSRRSHRCANKQFEQIRSATRPCLLNCGVSRTTSGLTQRAAICTMYL